MKTKPIPAIIMLTAGFVACIVGILQHFSFGTYVKILFLVLIGFYFLGCIVKLFLDKGFRVMDDPLSEFEDLEIDDDLMDDLAMTEEEYQDEYQDN